MLRTVAFVIQLAYQPAYDPFHTVLRLIRIADFVATPPSVDQVRIADFYLSFPARLAEVKFPRGMRGRLKSALAHAPVSYGTAPADETVIRKMRPIQDAAIQTLLGNGSLDHAAFEGGTIALDTESVPEKLLARARTLNCEQEELVDLIRDLIAAVPLEGADGLKHRTGLGEHRYDAV
jgi:hypothetical protein